VIVQKKGNIVSNLIGETVQEVEGEVAEQEVTYNWPYDFFSLVELVKIDTEVEFSSIEKDPETRSRVLRPIQATREKVMKNKRDILFGESAKKQRASEEAIQKAFEKKRFED